MFLEAPHMPGRTGWIEVVCGSMFSGKTEELIRRLKRASIAGQRVELYKPLADSRYHEQDVVSHEGRSIAAAPVSSSQQILLLCSQEVQVVGLDEAQFFDDGIVEVVNGLANRGVRVVVAGLDMDFKGKPFGPMPHLMAIAEYVTKLHAICTRTGQLAHYSYRLSTEEQQHLLGAEQEYEALSREAYLDAMRHRT